MMTATEFLARLKSLMLAHHYREDLAPKVNNRTLLLRKGKYVFLALPFADAPPNDVRSRDAKMIVRESMTCVPGFWERGLFLVYYGPAASWRDRAKDFAVDYTAMRPVILQCVYFLDPETGEAFFTRTNWGSIQFGFCGGVLADLETLAKSICAPGQQLTS